MPLLYPINLKKLLILTLNGPEQHICFFNNFIGHLKVKDLFLGLGIDTHSLIQLHSQAVHLV